MHTKLFIPGPIEVPEDTRNAQAKPMIGHRDKEFSQMFVRVTEKLKKVFQTNYDVFVSTSSATGLMEGAVRNAVSKRVLSCINGAFSQRWYQIALENGKEADPLEVEWGKAIRAEMIKEKLKTGRYDAVTLVHNESSTAVMSPIEEISEVMKEFPDVMLLVDAVSSFGGYPFCPDKLGIDVLLAGAQKALACPPGIAVCSVSPKCLEKAKTVKNRGTYFDFVAFKKYIEKGQTPNTPAISLIYALEVQLDKIIKEGLENRYRRHLEMAKYTRQWGIERFGKLFAEPGYESVTLTAIVNTRGISIKDLIENLRTKGYLISNGYGDLKEKNFRIAHMGECTLNELKTLLSTIDEILASK